MAQGQFKRRLSEMDGIFDEVEAARGGQATLGAKIGTKQDSLTFDVQPKEGSANPVTSGGVYDAVFGLGALIAEGDDINTYTTPGVYYIDTAAHAATLINSPTSDPFRLEVKPLHNIVNVIQVVLSYSSEARIYARTYTASGWGSWRAFTTVLA